MDEKRVQLKDERVMTITLETLICYRERKFPEGDQRRACHLGLETLVHSVCQFCTWTGTEETKKVAALSGPTMLKLVEALKVIQAEDEAKGRETQGAKRA